MPGNSRIRRRVEAGLLTLGTGVALAGGATAYLTGRTVDDALLSGGGRDARQEAYDAHQLEKLGVGGVLGGASIAIAGAVSAVSRKEPESRARPTDPPGPTL